MTERQLVPSGISGDLATDSIGDAMTAYNANPREVSEQALARQRAELDEIAERALRGEQLTLGEAIRLERHFESAATQSM